MMKPVSFGQKFLSGVLLSLLLASTVLLLGSDIGRRTGPMLIFGIAALAFMLPLILLPVWEYRDRKHAANVAGVLGKIQYLIACLCGLGISIFGWRKVFSMQFRTPLSIADLPMSSQDGEALTWFYFGHSVTFGLIVAVIQIVGSFLLFFDTKRLAGVLILLPVMVNIVLINIFYNVNIGALAQSLILTAGLLYILFQYRQQLMQLLNTAAANVGSVNRGRNSMIALVLIATGFLLTFLFRPRAPQAELYGVYDVKKLTLNGITQEPASRLAADSVLTKVYFDLDDVCVFEYNSVGRRLVSGYNFNQTTKAIESDFLHGGTSRQLRVKAAKKSVQQLELKGTFGTDSLEIELVKAR